MPLLHCCCPVALSQHVKLALHVGTMRSESTTIQTLVSAWQLAILLKWCGSHQHCWAADCRTALLLEVSVASEMEARWWCAGTSRPETVSQSRVSCHSTSMGVPFGCFFTRFNTKNQDFEGDQTVGHSVMLVTSAYLLGWQQCTRT